MFDKNKMKIYLREIFSEKKKENGEIIVKSTIDNYVNNICSVLQLINYTNIDTKFLKKTTYIFNEVNNSSNYLVASKKVFFIALRVLSKLLNEDEKITTFYNKYMLKFRNDNNLERAENIVNEDKLINWSILKNIYDRMIVTDFYTCRDKLLVGLYVKNDYVMRNDYASVIIIYSLEKDDNVHNFLVLNEKNNSFTFIFNNFKNIDKFGKIIFTVTNNDLINLLTVWLYYYNTDQKYLLSDINMKKLSKETTKKKIKSVFSKYAKRKVNLDMIRHSVTTYIFSHPQYNNLTNKDQEALHRKICHSMNVAKEYKKLLTKINLKDHSFI